MRHRWLYERWFAVVVGFLGGAAVGIAVYWGSHLSGAGLFALCGTVAGGVAALVFYGYSRTVHLTELKVSIPHLTDLTFAVTQNNEGIAWRLFVESATRISTQPLDDGAGIVREALNSLYTLFQSIRKILLEAKPTARTAGARTVEQLAIAMLNTQMRPFMSTWHARLAAWEKQHPDAPESAWPDNAECRAELETMRLGLLQYVRGLGELAGIADIDSLLVDPTRAAGVPAQPSAQRAAG
jgi:hypothetical protein